MGCIAKMRAAVGKIRDFWKDDVTVEPVVFLYMAAIFMEMSVTQDLIKTKLCIKEYNATDYHVCHNLTTDKKEQLSSASAIWIGYYSVTMFFFAILTTIYIGSWSDRFSRRIPMFIPPVGSVLAVITLIINSTFWNLDVSWMLLSAAISGLSGGVVAVIAVTNSYIAAISSVENRTKRVVILEANIFIGGTLGMIVGGAFHKYLFSLTNIKISSYSGVFLMEMGLIILTILYILLKVEDITPATQPTYPGHGLMYKLFNLNHLKDIIYTTFMPREENRRCLVLLVLLASFLVNYSLSVQTSLNFVFLSDKPLLWDQEQYSYYTALNFAVSGLSLIVGLPIFYYFKLQDTTLALLGVASKMAGLVLLGFSSTPTMVYLCPLLYLFSEFCIPALRSILSKLVGADEKGKIFALMQLLQNVALLTGSEIFNPLYKATSHIFKGLCFEIVAGIQGIAIIIVLYLHFEKKPENGYAVMPVNGEADEEEMET